MRSPTALEAVVLFFGTIMLGQLAILAYGLAINRAWRRAARELGLVYERRRSDRASILSGTMDGLEISISAGTQGAGRDADTVAAKRGAGRDEWETCDVVNIDGAGAHSTGVSVHPRVHFAAARGIPTGIPTGDAEFDARFRIEGSSAGALAMLGRDARRFLLDLRAPQPWTLLITGSVSEPILRVLIHGEPRGVEGKVRAVRAAAAIARATRLEGGIADGLTRNVRSDVQAVRMRSLRCLIDAMGEEHPAVKEACRLALNDESAEIRVVAARELGADGVPVLLALVLDADEAFDVRAEAARAFVEHADDETFRLFVDRHLDSADAALRRLAIEAVGDRSWIAALPRLLEPRPDAHPSDIRATAIALRKLGDSAAEPILIEWLGSPVSAVAAASARALGFVGSIAAVEPLLPLARGAWGASEVRAAARDALRRIQSRLGPVEAGRLALVDVDGAAGALSEADDAAGRVAIDEAGSPREDAQK